MTRDGYRLNPDWFNDPALEELLPKQASECCTDSDNEVKEAPEEEEPHFTDNGMPEMHSKRRKGSPFFG